MSLLLVLVTLTAALRAQEIVAVSPRLAAATTSFSVDLFKELAAEQPEGNLVVSPLSVSTLLSLVQQGAGGQTQADLTKVLHATVEETKHGYSRLTRNLQVRAANETLEFANGAFLNQGYQVRQSFRNVLVQDFQATVQTVQFADAAAAAQDINTWVADHTHDLIKQLISADMLSADTRLVLTNAIYYKDVWATPFPKEGTHNGDFYVTPTQTVSVPMMHLSEKRFKCGVVGAGGASWLALPFKGDRFSLVVILPDDRNGLSSVVSSLTAGTVSDIIAALNTTWPSAVDITLPKFSLQTKLGLAPTLKKLGLQRLFTSNAQLNGISEEPVYVSDVIQKAVIQVDEEGATAAAATGVIMVGLAIMEPRTFTVDHPFIALLVDEENSVPLFVSRIVDPAQH